MEEVINKKDYSISFCRLLAMVFIITCHILQRDNVVTDVGKIQIKWAAWFNVGVQMFLFISGYLYGRKGTLNTAKFIKSSTLKILVDYYIFATIVIALYVISPVVTVSKIDLLGLYMFLPVEGVEHLWFVSTILICYLLTPILKAILDEVQNNNDLFFWVNVVGLLVVVHLFHARFLASDRAWTNCYILGMVYSYLEKRKRENRYCFYIMISMGIVLLLITQLLCDIYSITTHYNLILQYGHVFLGVGLVIVFRKIFSIIRSTGYGGAILDWSDQYSYDVYLVHHILIQSKFACVEYIPQRILAIPLALVLTVLFAVLLNNTSKKMKEIVNTCGMIIN